MTQEQTDRAEGREALGAQPLTPEEEAELRLIAEAWRREPTVNIDSGYAGLAIQRVIASLDRCRESLAVVLEGVAPMEYLDAARSQPIADTTASIRVTSNVVPAIPSEQDRGTYLIDGDEYVRVRADTTTPRALGEPPLRQWAAAVWSNVYREMRDEGVPDAHAMARADIVRGWFEDMTAKWAGQARAIGAAGEGREGLWAFFERERDRWTPTGRETIEAFIRLYEAGEGRDSDRDGGLDALRDALTLMAPRFANWAPGHSRQWADRILRDHDFAPFAARLSPDTRQEDGTDA